jgi:hypothetical protein
MKALPAKSIGAHFKGLSAAFKANGFTYSFARLFNCHRIGVYFLFL